MADKPKFEFVPDLTGGTPPQIAKAANVLVQAIYDLAPPEVQAIFHQAIANGTPMAYKTVTTVVIAGHDQNLVGVVDGALSGIIPADPEDDTRH